MFGLGSSTQLGIGIAISLNDQFSSQAAKVNQQLLAMRKNANSAVSGAIQDYRNNAAIIAAGAIAASAGMLGAAKAGAEFQHSINKVFIIGGKQIGQTRKSLEGFATSFSKEFSRTPLEVANAMYENVKAGVTTGLEEITRYQVAAATATGEALEGSGGVAEKLLGIMNSYGLATSQFKDMTNAVVATANASISNVEDIGKAMEYAGFRAKSFNIPLETTLAMVAKLSQAKIQGTSAGTGIANMLTQMSKSLGPFQTKQMKEAWAMLGLDPKQISAMANKGNMEGVLMGLAKATEKMDPITRSGLLTKIFNMRGDRAAEGIMLNMFDNKKGQKTLADFIQAAKLGVKDDIVAKQSKAMMNDLDSDFKFFTNAMHRFKIAFTNAAAPTLRTLMHIGVKIVNFVGSIIDSPIGKVLTGIAVVAVPLVGILFAFRAAALTATLAMRAMAMTSRIGGFGSLLGSGLNMAGLARFGNLGGSAVRNAAGRYMVQGGQTINWAGKLYKGGQILPKAFLAEAGLAGGAGAAGGLIGRGLGMLGTIGGFLGRAVPILGGILLGVEVLKMLGLKGEAERTEKRNDPLINEYYRNLDQVYMGYGRSDAYYNKNNQSMYNKGEGKNGNLSQNIIVNIDGQKSYQSAITKRLEDDLNTGINFQIPD